MVLENCTNLIWFLSTYCIYLVLTLNEKLSWLFPDLERIDRGVLMQALKILEQKGKAAIIESSSADTGVKFAA